MDANSPLSIVVQDAYRHAISTTFLAGSLILAFAFILVLFLPEHPLRSAVHQAGEKTR